MEHLNFPSSSSTIPYLLAKLPRHCTSGVLFHASLPFSPRRTQQSILCKAYSGFLLIDLMPQGLKMPFIGMVFWTDCSSQWLFPTHWTNLSTNRVHHFGLSPPGLTASQSCNVCWMNKCMSKWTFHPKKGNENKPLEELEESHGKFIRQKIWSPGF